MKVEGRNAVREAILQGAKIDKIYFAQGSHDATFRSIVDLAFSKNIKCQFVDSAILNSTSVTHHHQGMIAFVADFEYCRLEDILDHARDLGEDPFILLCDGIEDPHNLGSIIRVCECLGVHGIVIPKNRACQVNETVVKVSAGATSYVKIARVTNLNDAIRKLKDEGVFVYDLELGGESVDRCNMTGPIAIVVGSEGFGTHELTRKLSDQVVTIPMYGKVNSLNASVACGMILYEARRQRDGRKN